MNKLLEQNINKLLIFGVALEDTAKPFRKGEMAVWLPLVLTGRKYTKLAVGYQLIFEICNCEYQRLRVNSPVKKSDDASQEF